MSNEADTPKIFYAPPGSSNAWVDAKNSHRVKSPPPLVFQNRDYPRAQKITCVNNLKQVGLAFLEWSRNNDDQFPFIAKFPFNVSTNTGGTMEFCAKGGDGFDRNAARHFQVMSNELNTPKLLVCPQDKARKPAADFVNLQVGNVTYQLHSGTNISEANPREILVVCPIDGNILYCDGTVKEAKK